MPPDFRAANSTASGRERVKVTRCASLTWHAPARNRSRFCSLAERGVLEEAEAVALARADVGGDGPVQRLVPLRVLVDEAVGGRLVPLVLHAEHASEQAAHHVAVPVVVDAEPLRLAVEGEQAVFEEVVPLH